MAHVYSTTGQLVSHGEDIQFPAGGILDGFTQSTSTLIVAGVSGRYAVRFVVNVFDASRLGLIRNDVAVPGGAFGSDFGGQISGELLIDLEAGDALSVRSVGSDTILPSPVFVQNLGTSIVNAALTIQRVA